MDNSALRRRLDVIIILLLLIVCLLGALAFGQTPGSEFGIAIAGVFTVGILTLIIGSLHWL